MAIARSIISQVAYPSFVTTDVSQSITIPANSMALVCLTSLCATSPPVPTFSGLGLTWTVIVSKVDSGANATFHRLTWAYALNTTASAVSGSLTIGGGGGASIGYGWDIEAVTGHDTTTPISASASNSGTGGNPAVTMPATTAYSGNRVFVGVTTGSGQQVTPATNFTELYDSTLRSIETQWRSDAYQGGTITSSTGSSQWATTAVEVAAARDPYAIDRVTLTSGSAATGTTSGNTASVSPAPNALLLVTVVVAYSSGSPSITMSGLGLTWTLRDQIISNFERLCVFTAQCGASPGSGVLSFSFGGAANNGGAVWDVEQISGHDVSSPVAQTATGSGNSTAVSVTLPNAPRTSASRIFAAFGDGGVSVTPGANLTEIIDLQPGASLETMWRADAFQATASGTIASSQPFVAVAVEVAANPATTNVSGSDTGSFTEAALFASLAGADTGTLVDTGSVTIPGVDVSDADTGALTDAASLSSAAIDGDTGNLVEAMTTTGTVADGDTGTLADVAVIMVSRTDVDTLGATEAAIVAAIRAGADTGTFTDAATVIVPPPPLPMVPLPGGKLITLSDEFSGGDLNTTLWTIVSGAVTVDSGRLLVDTAAGQAVVQSAHTYDARASEFVIRGIGAEGASVLASLELVEPNGSLGIHLVNDALTFRIEHDGAVSDLTEPYDPASDVFWRIQESGGQVLMDTSADGLSWAIRRKELHYLNLSAVRVVLTVASFMPGTWGHGPWGYTLWGGTG